MAIKKICPRCRKIIDSKDCPDCADWYKKRHKEYDSSKRNKKARDFYHSKAWEKKREEVLTYYSGLDIYQLIINKRKVAANTVHHIKEIETDWELKLAFDNLIPLSDSTHMLVHGMYRQDKQRAREVLVECCKKYQELIGEGAK